MAFTLDKLSVRFRADMGGRYEFICADVTGDGSTTTIDASTLGWTSINSAMVVSKANLEGTLCVNLDSIAAAAGTTSVAITVTGAALGDFCMAAAGVDLTDLLQTSYVQAGNKVEVRLQNETAGAIDLADTAYKAQILKNVGLSTTSGTYIVVEPIVATGDKFTVWLIGH